MFDSIVFYEEFHKWSIGEGSLKLQSEDNPDKNILVRKDGDLVFAKVEYKSGDHHKRPQNS